MNAAKFLFCQEHYSEAFLVARARPYVKGCIISPVGLPMNPDPLNPQTDDATISRRTLVPAIAFVPLAALTASAQTPAPAAAPAKALDAAQRRILEAFLDRLIPKDELGPGAAEGGAAQYIARFLPG